MDSFNPIVISDFIQLADLFPMQKRLLFVCLGNICRSPAAEGVFLSLIKSKGLEGNFLVDSAGTGAWHVGNLPDERMLLAAKKRGVFLTSRARQIVLEDLKKFDLILTMDSDNLSQVKSLAASLPPTDLAEIKPILSYSRNTNLLDVPDPYYGGEAGFEEVLNLLEDSCKGLLKELMDDQ